MQVLCHVSAKVPVFSWPWWLGLFNSLLLLVIWWSWWYICFYIHLSTKGYYHCRLFGHNSFSSQFELWWVTQTDRLSRLAWVIITRAFKRVYLVAIDACEVMFEGRMPSCNDFQSLKDERLFQEWNHLPLL